MRDSVRHTDDARRIERSELVVVIELHTRKFAVTYDFINADQFMDTAVGGRARILRRSKQWSRHVLAKKAGIAAENVELFERQPWAVPLRVVAAIAKALGVAPCELSDSDPKTYVDRID